MMNNMALKKLSIALLVVSIIALTITLFINSLCFVFGRGCFENIFTSAFWQYFLSVLLLRPSLESFFSSLYIFEVGFVLLCLTIVLSLTSILFKKKAVGIFLVFAILFFGLWGFYFGGFLKEAYSDPEDKVIEERLRASNLTSRSLNDLFAKCELSFIGTDPDGRSEVYLPDGRKIEPLSTETTTRWPIFITSEEMKSLMKIADKHGCDVRTVQMKSYEDNLANCNVKEIINDPLFAGGGIKKIYFTDGTYVSVKIRSHEIAELKKQLLDCGIVNFPK